MKWGSMNLFYSKLLDSLGKTNRPSNTIYQIVLPITCLNYYTTKSYLVDTMAYETLVEQAGTFHTSGRIISKMLKNEYSKDFKYEPLAIQGSEFEVLKRAKE
jgi:hypothetical protein